MRGLSKRFGHVLAVDRFDLDVPHGSFFGLLDVGEEALGWLGSFSD